MTPNDEKLFRFIMMVQFGAHLDELEELAELEIKDVSHEVVPEV